MSDFGAVVLAGGASARMGGIDKLWHPIAGRPLFAYAVDVFERFAGVRSVALLVAPSRMEEARAQVRREGWRKVVSVSAGGARRQDSAALGLAELSRRDPTVRRVMVHDGARPLVEASLLEAGAATLARGRAAIPVLMVRDTVREVVGGEALRALDRARIGLVQTPQLFERELLERAFASPTAAEDATDDAVLIERLGERALTFPGSPSNLKVTTPEDLAIVEAVLLARGAR